MSYFEIAHKALPALLAGLQITLELWVLTLVFGGVLGILIALVRVYGNRPLYYLATWYVEFVRGTPMLVQLFILYYGLGDVGIFIKPFAAATLAFSLNTAAYQAEYVRGAMQSIRGGQMEAARAIGLTQIQCTRRIVLPQALRLVIPQWSNEAIIMLKATSLAFMVTVPELMAVGNMIAARNYRYLEVISLVALLYLVVVLFFTFLLDMLEKRCSIPGMGGKTLSG
jgi:polar amino acid transport system permease protein